jgi:signal transduction histidine kinase
MKLKHKLFLSYLLLIFFFSIALVLLSLQLRTVDQFVRIRIGQDIFEILDLSRQQQILEDVYAQYLLIRLAGSSQTAYQNNLIQELDAYNSNWQLYKSRRDSLIVYTLSSPLAFIVDIILPDSLVRDVNLADRWRLEEKCQLLWNEATYNLQHIGDNHGDSQIPEIKPVIGRLRQELSRLSEIIGTQTGQTGEEMTRFFSILSGVILFLLLLMVLLSLTIAFIVTRRFSKPLDELKTGIEQIAIQNFDVKIPDKSGDEIGELATAFEQMALRLKENERFKTEMLNQFTHEMKSPLAAIYQAMSLLEHSIGPEPTDNQKRLLSIINGNNETLSNLITNILHSASYDAENLPLTIRRENIVKIFTNSIIKLAPTIKQKEMKVDLNFASEKIETDVDKDRIEEVFFNLLSNAIKFSPKGSTLKVSILETEALVDISLKDQGIGIPKKEIPYIFEKMYRASNSTKISVKGTGLGLYITSQIVKAHGGKIRVVSKENFGTEFTVQLPKACKENDI